MTPAFDRFWIGCVATWMFTAACASRSEEISPSGCTAFDGVPVLNADVIPQLAGEFELVLFAASGAHAGGTVKGSLTLRANTDELRRMTNSPGNFIDNVIVPFYGSATIDVDAVGGLTLGGSRSDDPEQPGVLMVQTNSRSGNVESLVMRLGSDGNRRDVIRFDGGYTVLRVRYVTRDTIRGEWASGAMTETAAGHFCATMVP